MEILNENSRILIKNMKEKFNNKLLEEKYDQLTIIQINIKYQN